MVKTVFLALTATLMAAATPASAQDTVGVRLETSAGPILLALDARHAPKTVANFMKYVDDDRFDGTQFYRASRGKGDPGHGFVQGGIARDARRILPSVPLEPTSETGITHTSGTISMAHGPDPDSADGNFSIMVGDNHSLDARGDFRGFAAFGHVVKGMDVVRKMLAMKTGGGRGSMRGQMILKPVTIVHAVRLNGKAKPTGRSKPWLIDIPR